MGWLGLTGYCRVAVRAPVQLWDNWDDFHPKASHLPKTSGLCRAHAPFITVTSKLHGQVQIQGALKWCHGKDVSKERGEELGSMMQLFTALRKKLQLYYVGDESPSGCTQPWELYSFIVRYLQTETQKETPRGTIQTCPCLPASVSRLVSLCAFLSLSLSIPLHFPALSVVRSAFSPVVSLFLALVPFQIWALCLPVGSHC